MAATAAGSSAESEALRLAFSYLVNSIDSTTVIPAALSAHLMSESQRSECASETAPFKRAKKFLDHLQRAVNGGCNTKYHTFIRVLKETGQASIASRLHDELTKASRLMLLGEQFDVSDELLEDLAELRVDYASLLYEYKNVLESSPEAQKKFVDTLPGLLGRSLGPDRSFQSYFNKLVDEEVSLFNINYLNKLCRIFPADVSTTTKKLVDSYKQQCQTFMASKTVNQFRALFPASATPSKLLTGKLSVELRFLNVWGDHTLNDLKIPIGQFTVPGKHLYLSKIDDSYITVIWLCSTLFIKELKEAAGKASKFFQIQGVLKVFIEEELVLECSQPDQESVVLTQQTSTFHFVDQPDTEYICPICTNLLTQPFLTDCGHHLCHTCLNQLLTTCESQCPICRGPDMLTNARRNKALQQQVNSIKVCCRHHEKGCEWVGEVRYLQDHLDRERRECAIQKCPFDCGKYCWKGEMKNHMKHHCVKRLTTCEYCGYHNTHDIVTENHYPACLQFPIDCPNKCTVKRYTYKRHLLHQHLNECPLQLVECPCSNTGCSVQLPRREMAAHTLQQHNQVLINQAVAITSPPATVSPQYLYNLPPVVFTITDYQEKKQANEEWTSPPYYTRARGYKFCLKVYPNGDGSGKGTHISVYAFLMRGEYDDELEWPFKGGFMFELLNSKNQFSQTVDFNKFTCRS